MKPLKANTLFVTLWTTVMWLCILLLFRQRPLPWILLAGYITLFAATAFNLKRTFPVVTTWFYVAMLLGCLILITALFLGSFKIFLVITQMVFAGVLIHAMYKNKHTAFRVATIVLLAGIFFTHPLVTHSSTYRLYITVSSLGVLLYASGITDEELKIASLYMAAPFLLMLSVSFMSALSYWGRYGVLW